MADNKIKQRVFYALFIPTLCVFSMGFVFVLMQWFHVELIEKSGGGGGKLKIPRSKHLQGQVFKKCP